MLILPALSFCYEYELTICAIFQNEAPYLTEWLEFHQRQGVQHFYLYNNNSTDNWEEILEPYIINNIVTLTDWAQDYEEGDMAKWNSIQCGAYNHCLKQIRGEAKWCAFIDLDEFLFSPYDPDLLLFNLSKLDKAEAIGVNCIRYGTSNKMLQPQDSIIDNLVMRSTLKDKKNLQIKSIVKPDRARYCVVPNWFFLKNQNLFLNEYGSCISGGFTDYVSVDFFRINHYIFRDEMCFSRQKVERYKKWGYRNSDIEDLIDLDAETLNDVEDKIVSQL